MASLDDFISTEEPSIEELSVGFGLGSPVVSKASNLNLATYAAALSGDPEGAVNTYRTVNAELDSGISPTLDSIKSEAVARASLADKQVLTDILLSPEYTDEEKKAAALTALDSESKRYDFHNMLSIEAVKDPAGDEDAQMEMSRVQVGMVVDQVNEVKRQEQIIYNNEMAKEDPATMQKVLGFAEMLIPFTDQKVAGDIASAIDRAAGGEGDGYLEAFAMLGSLKDSLPEILARVPPEERLAVTQSAVDIINEMSSVALVDGNDFRRKEYLDIVLQQGSYDTPERWLDNVVGVLDVIGLGATVKSLTKGAKVDAAISKIQKRLVKTRVQPSTVGQNYKDVNPEKAKATYEMAVSDETGEAAQALYGTTKEEVIASEVLPEILDESGEVIAKVGTIDKAATDAADEVVMSAKSSGRIDLYQAEKEQMRAGAVERFKNVVGMEARTEMFQYGAKADGVAIRAVYGPSQGGFASPEQAMEMAEWALRNEGVTRDQIKILVRDGANYRVAKDGEFGGVVARKRVELQGQEPSLVSHGDDTLTDIGSTVTVRRKPKDFLVMVEHDYKFRPTDVVKWSEADVKYNLWDRYVGTKYGAAAGKIWANVMDRASTFSRELAGSAVVATDRAAGMEKTLLDLAKPVADTMSKADPQVQEIFRKLVMEANEKGITHSYADMVAAGLRDSEIQAMKDFRKFWDTVYELENLDAVKTLRNRGYMEFIDSASDTRLFAKPISRNMVGKVGRVFDSSTGQLTRLTGAQVAKLYEEGGAFAKLRQPMVVGDEAAEVVIVKNQPGTNYLRGLTDDSKVLNYRQGYFQVHYTEPYFVVQKVKNSRGEVLYERAVANVGSKSDAIKMAKAKAATEGKVYGDDYYERGDIKQNLSGSDDYWDVQQVQGRTAQRVRGKRLEESDTNTPTPDTTNIMNPVESMIKSARSVAHRTSMRDMMETMKSRFVAQYEEFLPMGDYGQKVMPADIKDIFYRAGGKENPKKLADALTTFEYIKYLEDGYINAIDASTKALLKGMADIAGNAGWDKADKALRWMSDGRGPAALAKNLAFQAYLATNPLRQFVVQSHQAMQLMALFPRYLMSGTFVPQTAALMLKQLGVQNIPDFWLKGCGWSAKELEANFKAFQRSGQVAAIDKQNLVRGSLMDLADRMEMGTTRAGKAWRMATSPIHFMRRIGFDAGEYINTLTSWLAHRDDAIRKGKDFSSLEVQDEVAAASRNFTYNMNAAGDMKYNQSMLSTIFQFMQVPHKALLTMTFNRQLSAGQKLRLFAFNGTMYTLPPATMYAWFGGDGLDILPDNEEAREAIVQGLEGYTLNKLLSMASGEETSIDFSSLSPMDVHGMYDFMHGMFTTDAGTILASNPSGQLLFGGNPRLTNFVMAAARFTNLVDDYQEPTTFGQVANEFAKISSGWSNALKAAYALEYDRKYGTLGGTTNNSIPTPNAIAMAFGFGSMDEARKRYVQDKTYNKSKDFEADVKEWYKGYKQHITTKYMNPNEAEYMSRVYAEAWRAWGNDNVAAKRIVDQLLRKDLSNGDDWAYSSLMKNHSMYSKGELEELGRTIKFRDEEQRARYMETIQYIHDIKNIGEK